MTRFCKKCFLTKEIEEFPRDATKKDGYAHACKICKKEQHTKWLDINREAYNKKRREDPKVKKENRERRNQYVKNKVATNPNYIREQNLQKDFGLSIKDFEDLLLVQNNKCWICNIDHELYRHIEGKRFAVDHDHKTGKIRGLLCHKCNTSLGKFQDSVEMLQKAIDYLNFYKEVIN